MFIYLLISLSCSTLILILFMLMKQLNHFRIEQTQHAANLKEQLQEAFANHRARFDERQFEALKILQKEGRYKLEFILDAFNKIEKLKEVKNES